jgi:hypothetical protein
VNLLAYRTRDPLRQQKSSWLNVDDWTMATETAAPAVPRAASKSTFRQLRRSRRDTLVTPALLWRFANPQGPGTRVYVFNISLGGIAFRSRTAFEPAAVHFIRLAAGPLKLEHRVRVVWCRKREEGIFDIGAEFIQQRG